MMGDLNIEVTGCSACGHWHRVTAQKLDQPQQFDGQWWSHAIRLPEYGNYGVRDADSSRWRTLRR